MAQNNNEYTHSIRISRGPETLTVEVYKTAIVLGSAKLGWIWLTEKDADELAEMLQCAAIVRRKLDKLDKG